MRIKIKQSELYKYQQEATSKMKAIKILYNALLDPVYNEASFLTKAYAELKTLFSFPPSFRFYHIGEKINKNPIIEYDSLVYRNMWHNYWWIKNKIYVVENTDEGVWLDEYESKIIMNLRIYNKMLEKELRSYE